MQDDHSAAGMAGDDEGRALSLRFRQEVCGIAVKAQRKLIASAIWAVGRYFGETVLLVNFVSRATEHSVHRPRTRQVDAACAA